MFKEVVLYFSLTNLKGYKFIWTTFEILYLTYKELIFFFAKIEASSNLILEVEEDKDITSVDEHIKEI